MDSNPSKRKIDLDKIVKDGNEVKEEVIHTIGGYKLIKSTSDKFVKEKDLIVLKGHIFMIQSVSPKKMILKLYRKFKPGEVSVDGIFCYTKDDKFVKFKDVLKKFKLNLKKGK